MRLRVEGRPPHSTCTMEEQDPSTPALDGWPLTSHFPSQPGLEGRLCVPTSLSQHVVTSRGREVVWTRPLGSTFVG